MKKVLTVLIAALCMMLTATVGQAQTETYEFVTEWGSLGSGDSQFGGDIGPRGLTMDAAATLYVCDYGNQRIQAFTANGTFQYSFFSGYNAGIIEAGGYLYFTRPSGDVAKYDVTGTEVWTVSYSAPSWTLNGICLDSDGNLHVCDGYDSKVYKIDANTGSLIKEYPAADGAGWIAADNSGHVYIASGAGPIVRYTNDGAYDNSRLDLPPTDRAESMAIDGDGNIFVGTLNHFLRKYDASWNLLAEWGGEGSAPGQFTNPQGVTVDDQGYVYVSDGGESFENRRVQVFKQNNPPPDVGVLSLISQYTDKPAYDLTVRDDKVYVTTFDEQQLYILDVSDPADPVHLSTYTSTCAEVRQVELLGDYAYIACSWDGFEVIDISDPFLPTRVGPTQATPDVDVAVTFAFANGYAFLANRESGVRVYNVADPANPVYVTTYSTSAWASSIVVSGNYLYVGIEHSPNGFDIFDISNPPTQNKLSSLSWTNTVYGIVTDGDYAYHSAQWENTFNVVDVSNPSNPLRLGTPFVCHGDPWGIAISGDRAYLGERGYGLQLLDISNRANPTLLDEYATGGDPSWGIAVVGNYVYLADGPGGMKVFSTTGSQPTSDSLIIPSVSLSPCDNECVIQPVNMKLEQPIKGATIPLKIPEGIDICSLSTQGLITETWVFEQHIKEDSGFITTGLWNLSGSTIPEGEHTVFNIFLSAPRLCEDSWYIHWDTALSSDPLRALTFADTMNQSFFPSFDGIRDSTEIAGYTPGDFNGDGTVDISDLTARVDYMFAGSFAPCNIDAADVNGDCRIDIADLTYMVDYLFAGGLAPLCGCVTDGLTAAKPNPLIGLSTIYRNGTTVISINSPIGLRGVDMELAGTGVSAPENLVHSWDMVYGDNNGVIHLGLLDIDGPASLPNGIYGLIKLEGHFQILSATVADINHNSMIPLLGAVSNGSPLPTEFALSQNVPNPFNPITQIEFALPEAADVTLRIFNLLGQEVATLIDRRLDPGHHTASWDASDFASGIYLYKLQAGDFVETKKMILLK